MGIDMKAFMKPELKDRGTMEFPGIERYKDAKGNVIPFIIKRLSMKEIKEIRNNYKTKEVYRDKRNGDRPIIGNTEQVAVINDYDGDSAGLEIMVEAFVQPKLDDPELMEYYGVHDRLDMPNIIFPDKDDFKYADDCLMEACGLASKKNDKETVEEFKKMMLLGKAMTKIPLTGCGLMFYGRRKGFAWRNTPRWKEMFVLPILPRKNWQ